eukprot:363135-Chlamydomonas_euryale.AAC.1
MESPSRLKKWCARPGCQGVHSPRNILGYKQQVYSARAGYVEQSLLGCRTFRAINSSAVTGCARVIYRVLEALDVDALEVCPFGWKSWPQGVLGLGIQGC